MPKSKGKNSGTAAKAAKGGKGGSGGKVGKGGAARKKKTALQQPIGGGVRKPPPRRVKVQRVVVAPVLPCNALKAISGRADEKPLRVHLLAVLAYKAKYEQRLVDIDAEIASGNVTRKSARPGTKAKVTEATGEFESTMFCVEQLGPAQGKDYELKWGFSAGVGIDQLWYSPSKDCYVIVEAKGPGAKLLEGAKKGDQMSAEWVENSLISVSNSPSASEGDKDEAKKMLGALRKGPPPEVRGKVIEALPGGGATERSCPDKGIYHKQI